MGEDGYDGETIDDIDPDEVGFATGGSQVTVEDGENVVVYMENDECHRCFRDSVGVVVATTSNGEVIHHAICRRHVEQLDEMDNTMEYEIRYYD